MAPEEKNVLDSLGLEKAIKLGQRKAKDGLATEALDICQDITERFPHNKRARELLKKVLAQVASQTTPSQDPTSVELQSIISLYGQGQFQSALRESDRLLRHYPNSSVIYNILGVIHVALKNNDVAVTRYEKAIALKLDFVEAYYNLGICFTAIGKFHAAIVVFKRAILINPDYVDAHTNLGNVYNSQKSFNEAIASYKCALKVDPKNTDALNNLGNAFKAIGELDLAIQNYQQSVKLDSNRSDSLNNMGNAFKEKGEIDRALSYYQQAIRINPKYAEAYNNQGNAFRNINKIDLAIDSYKRALDLKPNYTEVYLNLANAFIAKGDVSDAMQIFEASFLIESNDVDVYLKISAALSEMGELNLAVDSFGKALLINPNRDDVYHDMGCVFLLNDDYDAAEISFKKAIELNPICASAYSKLGAVAVGKDNFEIAIETFNRAIELNPNDIDAYQGLASSLKQIGQVDAAIVAFGALLEIDPDSALAYSETAFLYFREGELQNALDALRKAIATKYKNQPALVINVLDSLFWMLQALKYEDFASVETTLSYFLDEISEHENLLAASLLQFKLTRSGASQDLFLGKVIKSFSDNIDRVIENPWNQEGQKKHSDHATLVALIHFGRSGTGFLHSLMDSHPDISTLPSIYFSEFFDHNTWAHIIENGWDGMIGNFMSMYEVLFDSRSNKGVASISGQKLVRLGEKEGMTCLGENKDESLQLDKSLFREKLAALMKGFHELDQLTFFRLVQEAYNHTIGDINKKKVLFYHIHNPDFYARLNLRAHAPEVKWITMVREPIQACESWVRTAVETGKYQTVVSCITSMFMQLQDNSYSKANTIGVRLEDVKQYPKETIPALCQWMGIQDHENVYKMTAQGKRWWGDSHSPDYEKDGMDPFGTTSISREVGLVFSETDQFILQTLFYPFSVKFGYAKENQAKFLRDLAAVRPMLDKIFDFEKNIAHQAHRINGTIEKIQTGVSSVLSLSQERDKEKFINFVDDFVSGDEYAEEIDLAHFKKSGYFSFLRSVLVENWQILNEFGTYPNLIDPLIIEK